MASLEILDKINLNIIKELIALEENDYIYLNRSGKRRLINISFLEGRIENICRGHGVDYVSLNIEDMCHIDECLDILFDTISNLGLAEAKNKLKTLDEYNDIWSVL